MCVFLSLLLLWSSWSLTLCSAYLMMSQECSGRTRRLGRWPQYAFKPSLPCGNAAAPLSWLLLFMPFRRTLPPCLLHPPFLPVLIGLATSPLAQLTVDTLTIYTHNRAPVAGALWEAWRAECLMMGNWQSWRGWAGHLRQGRESLRMSESRNGVGNSGC